MDLDLLKRYAQNTMPGKAAMAMGGLAKNALDDGRPNPEGQDQIMPTSSPIDFAAGGLGGMAAKGLVGSLGADAVDTSGAMLARKAALNKMGAGSIANNEASAPIAQLGDDITKTIESNPTSYSAEDRAANSLSDEHPLIMDKSRPIPAANSDEINKYITNYKPQDNTGLGQMTNPNVNALQTGNATLGQMNNIQNNANNMSDGTNPFFSALRKMMGNR